MWDGGTVVTLVVAAVLWRRWYTSRAAVRAADRPADRSRGAPSRDDHGPAVATSR
jgi:putative membrane protein